jgi:hypothetical protein
MAPPVPGTPPVPGAPPAPATPPVAALPPLLAGAASAGPVLLLVALHATAATAIKPRISLHFMGTLFRIL